MFMQINDYGDRINLEQAAMLQLTDAITLFFHTHTRSGKALPGITIEQEYYDSYDTCITVDSTASQYPALLQWVANHSLI